MFLFICLARVKCEKVQCGGLFDWSVLYDVRLNSQMIRRLNPDVESCYLLDGRLRDGSNSLVLEMKDIQREHKHVCTR